MPISRSPRKTRVRRLQPFVGAHNIDLLAHMRRHQDVQLHFAGDLRRGSLYRFRLGQGFRGDGRRRGLPEKRGELLAGHAGTLLSTLRDFETSSFANSWAIAAMSRAAAPSGSVMIGLRPSMPLSG